jgi:hypothetical protein
MGCAQHDDGAGGIVRLTRDQEHRARTGFDMVQADPPAAQRLLAAVVRSRSAGPTARVIAWWGLGRLAHDGGAIDAALTLYTDAVALAVDTEQFDLAAEVRISWSVCLSARGDNAAALDQLALAEPMLPQGRSADYACSGFVLASAGDREEAIAAYSAGLPLLLAAGDEIAAARLYSNRGMRSCSSDGSGRLRRLHPVAGDGGAARPAPPRRRRRTTWVTCTGGWATCRSVAGFAGAPSMTLGSPGDTGDSTSTSARCCWRPASPTRPSDSRRRRRITVRQQRRTTGRSVDHGCAARLLAGDTNGCSSRCAKRWRSSPKRGVARGPPLPTTG